MAQVTKETLRGAIKKRKDFVVENLDTLSTKILRRLLEEDLGLPEKSLREHKDYIASFVDKLVDAHRGETETKEANTQEAGKGPSKKARESKPKVQKKQKQENEEIRKSAAAGPKVYSKCVQKMKAVCKQAGITVPPNIYTKSKTETALEGAFEALLEKHGLNRNSTQSEISAAHRRLQTQKDLEGIDMSNIVEGGRRSCPKVDYSAVLKPKYEAISDVSEEEEEDEEDDEEAKSDRSDESDNENVRPPNGSVMGSQQNMVATAGKKSKREKEDEEEIEVEDEEGSEREASAGSHASEKADEEPNDSDVVEEEEERTLPSSGSKRKACKETDKVESPSKASRGRQSTPVMSPKGTPAHVANRSAGKGKSQEQQVSSASKRKSEQKQPKKGPAKRRTVLEWSDDE